MLSTTKNARIDYSKYQIEDILETIADVIMFPIYIGKVMSIVIIVTLFIISGLAYFYTIHWGFSILFILITFIVSLPSIILISIIRLINTISDDINKVIAISIETTKHVYKDSGLLKNQRQNGVSLKSSFTDVFRGVSLYIIRPGLKRVLSKKLGSFALIFTFIIDQLFKYIIIKKQPILELEIEHDKYLDVETKSLDEKIIVASNKVTSVSKKVIKLPFYLALTIYGIVNILLIQILIWIF